MPRYGLMHLLACFTLFDGDPQLVNTILDEFLAVTREDVHAAAETIFAAGESRDCVPHAGEDRREGGGMMATQAA